MPVSQTHTWRRLDWRRLKKTRTESAELSQKHVSKSSKSRPFPEEGTYQVPLWRSLSSQTVQTTPTCLASLSSHFSEEQGNYRKDTLNCHTEKSLKLHVLMALSTMASESTYVCQIPSPGPIAGFPLTVFCLFCWLGMRLFYLIFIIK